MNNSILDSNIINRHGESDEIRPNLIISHNCPYVETACDLGNLDPVPIEGITISVDNYSIAASIEEGIDVYLVVKDPFINVSS